jgi:hypothetical protein
MSARLVLTIPAILEIWQRKHPAGLWCRRCSVLLATTAASHNLTDAERRAFVCAECAL